jgi:hypothetical protein
METISFEADIVSLFRSADVQCMTARGVKLGDFEYMSDAAGDTDFSDHANARHVLARISGQEVPRMPLGAPAWASEKINLLRQWIDDGCPP